MDKVKIGLIGSGFVADIHAAAVKMVPEADVVAVASSSPSKAGRRPASSPSRSASLRGMWPKSWTPGSRDPS